MSYICMAAAQCLRKQSHSVAINLLVPEEEEGKKKNSEFLHFTITTNYSMKIHTVQLDIITLFKFSKIWI